MTRFVALALFLVAVSTSGCFRVALVTEGDQRSQEDARQSTGIATDLFKKIHSRTKDKLVKRYAEEGVATSDSSRLSVETVQRNVTGGPPTPQTWTLENAKLNRDLSNQQHKDINNAVAQGVGIIGGLSGFDIGGIIAFLTGTFGVGKMMHTSRKKDRAHGDVQESHEDLEGKLAAKEQEVGQLELMATSLIHSNNVALENVSKANKPTVLNQIARIQTAAGTREAIRSRLKA